MKKRLSFVAGWYRFICEVCGESFPVEDMFYEQCGKYNEKEGQTHLFKIKMLCEECDKNAH
jgi:hypothetical protein